MKLPLVLVDTKYQLYFDLKKKFYDRFMIKISLWNKGKSPRIPAWILSLRLLNTWMFGYENNHYTNVVFGQRDNFLSFKLQISYIK